jgi:hypothetical protein
MFILNVIKMIIDLRIGKGGTTSVVNRSLVGKVLKINRISGWGLDLCVSGCIGDFCEHKNEIQAP